MRRILLAIATSALLTAAANAQPNGDSVAAYVVIVHPGNSSRTVTRAFVADAFLKRTTRWPDGQTIRPADLDASSPVRRRFAQEILRRSLQAVRSYWQQIIFSGRGVPPVELSSERAVIRYVATHPGAIGYVSGASDVSGVGVVAIR